MVKDHSLPDQYLSDNNVNTDFEKCFVKISFIGIDSKWFANRLFAVIKRQFKIKLRVLFVTFKINCYFQLKLHTSHVLSLDVVYQFTFSRDTSLIRFGMSTRHLWIRAGKYLNSGDSHKSAKKDHLLACHQYWNGAYVMLLFLKS